MKTGVSTAANRVLTVLVTGSRNWADAEVVRKQLLTCHELYAKAVRIGSPGGADVTTKSCRSASIRLVHGAAKGLDSIAGGVAAELGFEVVSCPADWKTYGRGAGFRRNQEMIDDYSPDICFAFPFSSAKGGTQDTIKRFRKYATQVAKKPTALSTVVPDWITDGPPEAEKLQKCGLPPPITVEKVATNTESYTHTEETFVFEGGVSLFVSPVGLEPAGGRAAKRGRREEEQQQQKTMTSVGKQSGGVCVASRSGGPPKEAEVIHVDDDDDDIPANKVTAKSQQSKRKRRPVLQ